MTPLGHALAARIAQGGPISLSDYMAECLLHPAHGYYATRDPFGVAGDFTTAPEISQIFGEMVGLCLAQAWSDQGRPDPFVLAEIGPGRGTLMADVLRTIRALPGMRQAARVVLIEASARLRQRQAQALSGEDGASWAASVSDLPDDPLFLVANEFFDALPIRQFHRAANGWSEVQVTVADGRLRPGLAAPAPAPYGALQHRLADTIPGDVVETCPALPAHAGAMAERIAARGGMALVFDYGGWHSRGDTLQALRDHAAADPFADPGLADLTAHVDFEALALAFRAGGAAVTGMTAQGVFLERLGITARAEALARRLDGAARDSHIAAHRRLTHPQEMGNLFKVLACHPAACPPPPGLDPAPPPHSPTPALD